LMEPNIKVLSLIQLVVITWSVLGCILQAVISKYVRLGEILNNFLKTESENDVHWRKDKKYNPAYCCCCCWWWPPLVDVGDLEIIDASSAVIVVLVVVWELEESSIVVDISILSNEIAGLTGVVGVVAGDNIELANSCFLFLSILFFNSDIGLLDFFGEIGDCDSETTTWWSSDIAILENCDGDSNIVPDELAGVVTGEEDADEGLDDEGGDGMWWCWWLVILDINVLRIESDAS